MSAMPAKRDSRRSAHPGVPEGIVNNLLLQGNFIVTASATDSADAPQVSFQRKSPRGLLKSLPYLCPLCVLVIVVLFENIISIHHPAIESIALNFDPPSARASTPGATTQPSVVIDPSVPTTAPTEFFEITSWVMQEARGRVHFAISAVLLVLVASFVICISVSMLLRASAGERWRSMLSFIVPTLLLAAFCTLLVFARGRDNFDVLSSQLEKLMLHGTATFRGATRSTVVTMVSIQAMLAAFFVISLFTSQIGVAGETINDAIKDVRRRSQNAQTALFLGSGLLIAATFEISALYHWAASAPFYEGHRELAREYAQLATALAGFVFSAILLAMYLPVSLFLGVETRKILEHAEAYNLLGNGNEDAWLEQNGLSSSVWPQALRAVAVVGPILAGGPLKSILETLAG